MNQNLSQKERIYVCKMIYKMVTAVQTEGRRVYVMNY